jgi:uncharacterized protein (DUF305 family)
MQQWDRMRPLAAALALGLVGATAGVPALGAQTPAAVAAARSAKGYTQADVEFMQGMIGHHAQALVMAAMAPTHGASERVSLFCRKVMRSQRDEIELMETWLRDRGERVPDTTGAHVDAHADAHAGMHAGMTMDMSDHAMLMPGMLTPAQLARLDSARGPEFDRLFLTFMIQHHEGALTMVARLFDTGGAGQEPEIFGYATGVDADQRAEIERMRQMLAAEAR